MDERTAAVPHIVVETGIVDDDDDDDAGPVRCLREQEADHEEGDEGDERGCRYSAQPNSR